MYSTQNNFRSVFQYSLTINFPGIATQTLQIKLGAKLRLSIPKEIYFLVVILSSLRANAGPQERIQLFDREILVSLVKATVKTCTLLCP